jgi:hypothetical protein
LICFYLFYLFVFLCIFAALLTFYSFIQSLLLVNSKLVAADRKDNEENASLNRLGVNANHNAEASDDEGAGGIDPE